MYHTLIWTVMVCVSYCGRLPVWVRAHTYVGASYSGSAVCGSSLADQEFDNIQVVVMDRHMKGCQTVLLNTHMYTYMKHITVRKHIYIWNTHHNKLFNSWALWRKASQPCFWDFNHMEHVLSHLASCIGVGSSLQKELSYVHLSIFRGHMEWSKSFLLKRQQNEEGDVCCAS